MAKEFYATFDPATEALIESEAYRHGVPMTEIIRRYVERGIEGEKRDREVRERVAQIMGRRDA